MDEKDQAADAPREAATQGKNTSKLRDPFDRHGIALGDGRRLRLFRSDRFKQARIEFITPQGKAGEPDEKYTPWLSEHGWTLRSEERAWTKQLAKNTEEARFAHANSDLAAQLEFIELANLIRLSEAARKGATLAAPSAPGRHMVMAVMAHMAA
jgi:hypothetical protein